jgi:hypothetical protein
MRHLFFDFDNDPDFDLDDPNISHHADFLDIRLPAGRFASVTGT